jgi:hypothetical protein
MKGPLLARCGVFRLGNSITYIRISIAAFRTFASLKPSSLI